MKQVILKDKITLEVVKQVDVIDALIVSDIIELNDKEDFYVTGISDNTIYGNVRPRSEWRNRHTR